MTKREKALKAAIEEHEKAIGRPHNLIEKEAEMLGLKIMEILQLRVNANGRVDLIQPWGDKTAVGLGFTILRIVEENKKESHT